MSNRRRIRDVSLVGNLRRAMIVQEDTPASTLPVKTMGVRVATLKRKNTHQSSVRETLRFIMLEGSR